MKRRRFHHADQYYAFIAVDFAYRDQPNPIVEYLAERGSLCGRSLNDIREPSSTEREQMRIQRNYDEKRFVASLKIKIETMHQDEAKFRREQLRKRGIDGSA